MNVSRRKFLRVNGATLSLPFLSSVACAGEPGSVTDKPSKKLAIVYLPNGIVRRCFFPGEETAEIPDFIGGFEADKTKNERRFRNKPGVYPIELTETMQPLAPHVNDVSMITGLDRTYKNGQDVHAQGASCYLTSLSPEQAQRQGIAHPNGRTLDQVIGDAVGFSTVFNTLEISCNGFTAPKEPIEFDNISWYGTGKIAPSIREPRKLYDRLFMRESYRRHVADVTDLVLADAKTLSRKIASDDRHTLDEFIEMVRGIELRIKKMDQMLSKVDVKIPTNEVLPRGQYIQLQMDLMLLAFQMGMTNVCTFMIGPERWDATLMYEGVFDQPVQHHNMTHNQKGDGYKDLQKIDLFHLQQYAYLIQRMKEIKEVDGSPMLDHSLVAFGAGLGDGATHQYYDLPMIVAGKAQGQIKQGRLIKLPSGTLNSNLWLTFAHLMGLEIDSFADSNGVVSDLWT
ncbi:MAG: DUF1552 domain-containing protein [Planctomycetales bacterium]|nr:DUF1552 domain-containing protein [Planctomycetales bacterium]